VDTLPLVGTVFCTDLRPVICTIVSPFEYVDRVDPITHAHGCADATSLSHLDRSAAQAFLQLQLRLSGCLSVAIAVVCTLICTLIDPIKCAFSCALKRSIGSQYLDPNVRLHNGLRRRSGSDVW
jgi:hypothetical protein